MHGLAPRVLLGQEWWDATRQAAYRSTNFHCIACGVSKYDAVEFKHLEGHELYEIDYPAGRMTYIETVPLCHYCHSFIHTGHLLMLLQEGKITQEKYSAVLSHGLAVLKAAKLKSLGEYTGPIAPWGKWRLVIDGDKYPPIYKTHAAWLAAYQGGDGA